jgi:DNA-directed RNA polymerase specialized sigma24 family protein
MLDSVQEAEGTLQEAFLRAWDRRATYKGSSTVRAWLYKIATNICIDLLRQRPRRGLFVSNEKVSTPEQPIPLPSMNRYGSSRILSIFPVRRMTTLKLDIR